MLKPGVDAVWFGRMDLAMDLLKPGEKADWDHPYVIEAFDKILNLSKKTGVPVLGIPWPTVNVENVRAVLDKGAKIVHYSIDQVMIYDMCKEVIKELKG